MEELPEPIVRVRLINRRQVGNPLPQLTCAGTVHVQLLNYLPGRGMCDIDVFQTSMLQVSQGTKRVHRRHFFPLAIDNFELPVPQRARADAPDNTYTTHIPIGAANEAQGPGSETNWGSAKAGFGFEEALRIYRHFLPGKYGMVFWAITVGIIII